MRPFQNQQGFGTKLKFPGCAGAPAIKTGTERGGIYETLL
jgi:hypothetical protein